MHKEQSHTYVRNDAVEAHSGVDTDSGSPCKQLTKTFGLKRPAVYLSTVVYCSSSESLLYHIYICGTIILCVCIRMQCGSKQSQAKKCANINDVRLPNSNGHIKLFWLHTGHRKCKPILVSDLRTQMSTHHSQLCSVELDSLRVLQCSRVMYTYYSTHDRVFSACHSEHAHAESG